MEPGTPGSAERVLELSESPMIGMTLPSGPPHASVRGRSPTRCEPTESSSTSTKCRAEGQRAAARSPKWSRSGGLYHHLVQSRLRAFKSEMRSEYSARIVKPRGAAIREITCLLAAEIVLLARSRAPAPNCRGRGQALSSRDLAPRALCFRPLHWPKPVCRRRACVPLNARCGSQILAFPGIGQDEVPCRGAGGAAEKSEDFLVLGRIGPERDLSVLRAEWTAVGCQSLPRFLSAPRAPASPPQESRVLRRDNRMPRWLPGRRLHSYRHQHQYSFIPRSGCEALRIGRTRRAPRTKSAHPQQENTENQQDDGEAPSQIEHDANSQHMEHYPNLPSIL